VVSSMGRGEAPAPRGGTFGSMAVCRGGDPPENCPHFVKSPQIRHLRPILSRSFRSVRRAIMLDILRAARRAVIHAGSLTTFV
jgi:hypothetical protein